MKKLSALIISCLLVAPALAQEPPSANETLESLKRAVQSGQFQAPQQAITPGQRAFFQDLDNMEFSPEQGLQLANQVVQAYRSNSNVPIFPKAMELLTEKQKQQLQLSPEQVNFIFDIADRLGR